MKDVIRLSAARNGIRVVQDYNQGGDPNVFIRRRFARGWHVSCADSKLVAVQA